MNTHIPSLEFIKRKAKKLKKEQNISHTQALELLAKEYGFSNWKHCVQSLSKAKSTVQDFKQILEIHLSFTDWLKRHQNRNSPLGDLATDMLRDRDWPLYDKLEEYRRYLSFKSGNYSVIEALNAAWKSYKAYLKRKNSPEKTKIKKARPQKDTRKIVYIKNVNTLPYTKRSVEKFNPGDKAWISWNGRKAIPVVIVEVDERYYSFIMERPLSKAGDEYYLRLDEVRSTPELACINHVTN